MPPLLASKRAWRLLSRTIDPSRSSRFSHSLQQNKHLGLGLRIHANCNLYQGARVAPTFLAKCVDSKRFRSTVPTLPLPDIETRLANLTMAQINAIAALTESVQGLSLSAIAEQYPTAHPEVNPLDIYRVHLSNVLSEIAGAGKDVVYSVIMWTSSLEKGDFQVAVPAMRIKGKKPDVLATEWVDKFPEDDPLFCKPTANGPIMTFFIKTEPLTQAVLPMIRESGDAYGKNRYHGLRDPKDPSQGQKRMIVEFSSPNVAKPFHAGHLRSTIIGAFLANLYEGAGWNVRRINYLGDWGKQYGLLALAYQMYGDEEALRSDPIDHLFKLYVRISAEMEAEKNKIEEERKEGKDVSSQEANSLDEQARGYFKRMSDQDETVLDLWRRLRDLSIARYKLTYARLNIEFDEFSGESQVSETSMAKYAELMEQKKLTKSDGGASLIDFTELVPGKPGKQLGKAVVRKKDGTALYLTRDIGELFGRVSHILNLGRSVTRN